MFSNQTDLKTFQIKQEMFSVNNDFHLSLSQNKIHTIFCQNPHNIHTVRRLWQDWHWPLGIHTFITAWGLQYLKAIYSNNILFVIYKTKDTHLFAKFSLAKMSSQIYIFTYLLFLASTGVVPWVHFWLPASIGEIFRLVKVVLPHAFLGWAGAAHIIDKKAHKWSYFNLWANKCGQWKLKIMSLKIFVAFWFENFSNLFDFKTFWICLISKLFK